MSAPKKVAIIGSGNWGSAIGKIIGKNAARLDQFETQVNMWVFEEMIDGRKLTEIINTDHENVKYLPGHKLPENIVAIPDVVEACMSADIHVWVLPHQFVRGVCQKLKGNIKPDAIALSLIKGLDESQAGVDLISNVINKELGTEVNVLMGANLAKEVANGHFCETTIGCRNEVNGLMLKELVQADYFRVVVVEDATTVEICGALKNIVATGAGFVDGLGMGDNTKAAVIRLGLMEMVKFTETFYQGSQTSTFLESCGIADLVTTCYGGRNRRVAEAFVTSGKTIDELEQEMLNGQKIQGPPTAKEVYHLLKEKNCEDQFPLFVAIHKICYEGMPVKDFISCLKNHPEHM
ncbi:PREDICTED: glycerol-3-phosphate dehydrogenase [NAD(+)], cytoplasmic-like isoform X2 [Branchiostoma belcheri]|uniref:Glycerol-3-phosphate dehydrogenase [NAD(+)] n=1 Tax=Branchiostoma belcheri TaxID=7741 RepID=A0A6P5A8X8_BRABE|nr:PREDICTED: glycerol-3-phosphate dehydrogenase [NAD(+)], cytoplasmic-like isoform X2 [Branchiostoma belcheri]